MARDEIREKLETLMTQEDFVGKECCVVYLMVESRKLLEHLNAGQEYSLLKFYCDWIVHTKKDRSMTGITEIADKIDALVSKGQKLSHAEYDEILDFIRMPELRRELIKFLKTNKLPVEICEQDNMWRRFAKTLAEVLTGQPILNPTKSIKSIEISSFSDGAMVDIDLINGFSMSVGMGVDVV